jgi:hypothetical protein
MSGRERQQVKVFASYDSFQPQTSRPRGNAANEYDVEAILDRKGKKFLIKWKGYPESEATWEPAQACVGCIDILVSFLTATKKAAPKKKVAPKKKKGKKKAPKKAPKKAAKKSATKAAAPAAAVADAVADADVPAADEPTSEPPKKKQKNAEGGIPKPRGRPPVSTTHRHRAHA